MRMNNIILYKLCSILSSVANYEVVMWYSGIFLCLQIHKGFQLPGDRKANVAMAALLAQEGAQLHKKNSRGLTPLELCGDDVAALVTDFASHRCVMSMCGCILCCIDFCLSVCPFVSLSIHPFLCQNYIWLCKFSQTPFA